MSDLIYVKSIEDVPDSDEYAFYIDMVTVPFGGPAYLEGKDIQGEYFHEGTDIGPMKRVISYFSHGRDDLAWQDQPIGEAERLEKTDEGWIYRHYVYKHTKYTEFLKKLAEQKMLRASTTPHQNTVKKSAGGRIDQWHVTEAGPTIYAANPLAEQFIQKSLEELDMPVKKDPVTPVEAEVVETPAEPVVTPAPEAELNQFAKSISEQFARLEEKMASLDVQPTPAPQIDAATNARLDQIANDIRDIKAAFPVLAKSLTDALLFQLNQDQKSVRERQVEEQLFQKGNTGTPNPPRPSGKLPPHAPGQN